MSTPQRRPGKQLPLLEEFLLKCDFSGATALVDHLAKTEEQAAAPSIINVLWKAYCAFHLGEYASALTLYEEVARSEGAPPDTPLFLAATLYHMGRYGDAHAAAVAGPECALKARLLFHLAYRLGNEEDVLAAHAQLADTKFDQLSLGSMHFARRHYAEAAEAYKRHLDAHRDDVAVHVPLAMCYYQLEDYDAANDTLMIYTQSHPDSLAAASLRACNAFLLFNGKAAEAELGSLIERGVSIERHGLMRHNMTVFRGGEHALRVLPPLVAAGATPEAKLNLIVYHIRQWAGAAAALAGGGREGGDGYEDGSSSTMHTAQSSSRQGWAHLQEAYALVRQVAAPVSPSELAICGVVHTLVGQALQRDSTRRGAPGPASLSLTSAIPPSPLTLEGALPPAEHLGLAHQHFHALGASPTECDTIQGRQAMASALFLTRQFEEVVTYLTSIARYRAHDDDFSFNLGVSQAAIGAYADAEETLLGVVGPTVSNDSTYLSWLARCLVMNRKPRDAWGLYLRQDTGAHSSALLQVIADDCYRTGAFFIAAKAFNVLMQFEPARRVLHWEGLRGAAAGVLQLCVAGQEGRESLRETVGLLTSIVSTLRVPQQRHEPSDGDVDPSSASATPRSSYNGGYNPSRGGSSSSNASNLNSAAANANASIVSQAQHIVEVVNSWLAGSERGASQGAGGRPASSSIRGRG